MEFEDYILNQNLSQDTVRTYNYAINQFKKFLKRDIEKASREDVMKFLTAVRNKELSPATIRLMIHALRSYYNGFLDNEIVMRNIKVPRLERRIKAWLSEADVIKLINGCSKQRDKILILVLYVISPRISEVQRIKRSDINFKNKRIKIERRKKRGEFNISELPIDDDTADEIKKYLNSRKGSNNWLFPGNEGKPMSKKTIRRRLEKVCNIVGIKRVTPHQLRHSRASALASNGVSIKVIKELLGHSSISTTDIYSHLTPEDLAKQIPPFEWRK